VLRGRSGWRQQKSKKQAWGLAAIWICTFFVIYRPWNSGFCEGVVSCWLALFGLALFIWLALGLGVGFMLHYWLTDRARRIAKKPLAGL
jgi:hypothetical protein